MSSPFIHLHVHSEYSVLDGLARVPEIVERVKTLGMPAVALTDHGVIAGAPEFYYEAKKNDILPILGQEFYIVPDASIKLKDKDEYVSNRHLIMMALTEEGWHTLIELTSIANDRANYHYKPRLDHSILREYRGRFDGVAVTSACLNSEVAHALRDGSPSEANRIVKLYRDLFPNFFLELQRHDVNKKLMKNRKSELSRSEQDFHELQNDYNSYLIKASKKLDVPLVITNDSHYVKPEQHDIHDLLLAIQTKVPLTKEDRFRFKGRGYAIKSRQEMKSVWSDKPDVWKSSQHSMQQILKKASGFRVREMESTTWHIPNIPGQAEDPVAEIRKKCIRALKKKGLYTKKTYRRRLMHELRVIRQADFEQIFLIVEDYVNWARDNNIQVGPGRGSMVGSIVSWLLGITDIDPVKFRLLFERAINPARPSIPDFDIDFESERIEEVIEYVKTKYGKDNVTLIGTHNHMGPRGTVKAVLRTLEVPFQESNEISSTLPESGEVTGNKASGELMDAFTVDPSPLLLQTIEKYPVFKPASLEIQNLLTSFGQHAAGVIISDSRRSIAKEIPQMLIASSGHMASQYDMEAIKKLHLVKFDFLRLNTLQMLATALEYIGHDPFENMIDYYDKETFDMMRSGDLLTIFQFQGGAAKQCIMAMGVNNFEDLVAVNAIARPGSIKFLGDYVKNKKNPEQIDWPCEEVKPILEYTNGVILYQEQVMEIVKTLAGWDDLGADRIKEATKSKSGTEFNEMHPLFIDGCKKNGISKEAAETIWKNIDDYRSYGFNRAHSVAYALIGYKTAYLKCHYPAEWLTAVLNTNPDKNFAEVIDEVRRQQIPILLPDINRSRVGFSLTKRGIIFGLAQIRGIGEKVAATIIEDRKKSGKFKSNRDFHDRMAGYRAVNNTARYEALERAGALHKLEGGVRHSPTYEREYLGVYVSQHPLDEYRDSLFEMVNSKKNRKALASSSPMDCYWGGIITKVKPIVTKKGDAMAFATVGLFGENLDITLFPEMWKRVKDVMRPDSIVAIVGEHDPVRHTIVAKKVKVVKAA